MFANCMSTCEILQTIRPHMFAIFTTEAASLKPSQFHSLMKLGKQRQHIHKQLKKYTCTEYKLYYTGLQSDLFERYSHICLQKENHQNSKISIFSIFSAYWLRSDQHIDLLYFFISTRLFYCAGFAYRHGTGRWAVLFAKGCCIATTVALTFYRLKYQCPKKRL